MEHNRPYPEEAPAADQSPRPGVRLIVRRGALRRFAALRQKTAEMNVAVEWDRRLSERRRRSGDPDSDRRAGDRRTAPGFTWKVADFVVVNED
jgi:hypothetical protein